MNTLYERIAQGLARLTAPVDVEFSFCHLCQARGDELYVVSDPREGEGGLYVTVKDNINAHTKDCPWRLARELYPDLKEIT